MESTPETEPTAAPLLPPPARRPRWIVPTAAFAGASLTVLAVFAGLEAGAFDAFANIRPPASALAPVAPDLRVDRLLKLLESERDCDSDCLAELRGRADKSTALEQALSHLQESAATAEQRRVALEGEKAALAEDMNRKLVDLEAGYKQQLAALESEKTGLAGQMEKRTAELDAKHQQQVAALEAEKAALTTQMEKKAAQIEADHKQKIAVLEKRLADAESRLHTAMTRPEPAPWRKGKGLRTVPVAAEPIPPTAPMPVAAAPIPLPAATEAPQWTVLGMTATTVVVSTPHHRVVALAAGESLEGVKVERIDVAHGVAETSAGTLTYHQ
jgi:hypothetical protein